MLCCFDYRILHNQSSKNFKHSNKTNEHTGAYNFQTLNAPKFEEIKQESEKMLDEASICQMHMKTRCPVGNFSKIP